MGDPKIRILHIEDDKRFSDKVIRYLSDSFEFTQVQTGEDGLKTFFDNPTGFDLILCDYQLPGLSGKEIVKSIRQSGARIPIIANSSLSSNNEEMIKAGADLVLPKDMVEEPFAQDPKWRINDWKEKIFSLCKKYS